MDTITGEQLKAARTLLRMNQTQFAGLLLISDWHLRKLERTRGPLDVKDGWVSAAENALRAAGVELIAAGDYRGGDGGPGVRLHGTPSPVFENSTEPDTDVGDIRAT